MCVGMCVGVGQPSLRSLTPPTQPLTTTTRLKKSQDTPPLQSRPRSLSAAPCLLLLVYCGGVLFVSDMYVCVSIAPIRSFSFIHSSIHAAAAVV
jgi:hypothetical protein